MCSVAYVKEQSTYHFEAPLWNLLNHKVEKAKKPPKKRRLIQWKRSRVWCGNPGLSLGSGSARAVGKNAWNDGILLPSRWWEWRILIGRGQRNEISIYYANEGVTSYTLATGTTWRGSQQINKHTLFRNVYWHFFSLRNSVLQSNTQHTFILGL